MIQVHHSSLKAREYSSSIMGLSAQIGNVRSNMIVVFPTLVTTCLVVPTGHPTENSFPY